MSTCFYQSRESDEPHWTLSCRTRQILFGCYSTDLFPRLGVQPRNPRFLGLHNFVWSSRFLQPKRNFFSHLVSLEWSTALSPFILVRSAVLWPKLNSQNISFRIRLCCMFTCVAFKLHTNTEEMRNVSAH